jgi:hypothetical protein
MDDVFSHTQEHTRFSEYQQRPQPNDDSFLTPGSRGAGFAWAWRRKKALFEIVALFNSRTNRRMYAPSNARFDEK